ncbi:MAG: hypothetical protein Kow0077_04390 [Anaerolineae bacterium]
MNAKWSSRRADVLAVLVLVALWVGFFWRFLTPVEADQVSLVEGDFSGQFVAFGAYQAQRLWAGEVPLWNPYNNGGLPFLADTQSAVFYPPRLITVVLTGLTRQWTYHALELEMMAHVLATSLLMYAFLRRLLGSGAGSVPGALAGAITWAYGGFMTGYPPLQLALLEAVTWAPLIMLGIHECTGGETPRWHWLIVAGLGLGLSVMAGHPQTNWFLGLLGVAFLAFRVWRQGWRWTVFVRGAVWFGGLAVLLALVQLLPAFEYLQHTTRIDFGFEAKRNGFPVHDLIQLVFPRVVSIWSPLYVGVAGLLLVLAGLASQVRDRAFWAGSALFGLLFSLGGNAALYGLLYNILPGLKLFRGQERGAMVVAFALSVLAGQGMAWLVENAGGDPRLVRRVRRRAAILLVLTGFVTFTAFVLWLGPTQEAYATRLPALAFSALVAALAWLALPWLATGPRMPWRQATVIALIVFDLFSVGADNLLVEPIPAADRLPRPAVLAVALEDEGVPPARVDGVRAVMGNFGSMWGVPDIRGISPLWLQGPYAIIGQEFPNPLAWELFAVRYVFTDWQELPVPSQIVAQGEDPYGPVNAHLLADPRPFAVLHDDVWPVDSDAYAYAVLADPGVNLRQTVVLDTRGVEALPDLVATGFAEVVRFAPEAITIAIRDNPAPAVLSIALPHYPGWQASVDGQPVKLLRAYGALSAVVLPPGAREVQLVYDPWTFKVGAVVSGLAWASLLIAGLWWVLRR